MQGPENLQSSNSKMMISDVEIERLVDENKKLKAEIASRLSHLPNPDTQKSKSLAEEDLKRLQTEKDEIEKRLQALGQDLTSEMEWLQRSKEEMSTELEEVRKERDALVEREREQERRLDMLEHNSLSIIESLLVSNYDLVERMERKSELVRQMERRSIAQDKEKDKEKEQVKEKKKSRVCWVLKTAFEMMRR